MAVIVREATSTILSAMFARSVAGQRRQGPSEHWLGSVEGRVP